MTTVSDTIARLATQVAADRSTLEGLLKSLDEAPDDTTIKTQIATLNKTVADNSEALALAQDSERALMRSALPVAPGIITSHTREKHTEGHLWRSAVVMLDAHVNRRSIEEVLRERYPGSELTRDLCTLALNRHVPGGGRGLLERAASAPATTTAAGWAAELVQMQYSAFLWALRGRSAVGSIAWPFTANFSSGSPIKIPMEDDQPAPANLAAAFRAEGAPIRVGSAHLNMLTALPYSMGIIAAYTRELLRQSTPSIEEFVKRVMTRNTAEVLDNIVFDNQNVSATRPRGLTYGMDPADTAVATATPTYAQVDSDLNKRIRQLTGVRHMGGPNTYWVMSHSNAAALSGLITPTGIRFYPDVTAEGAVLKGYRVATSSYYKNDEVLLIDADQIFFAGGSPEFEVSDQATLHMENTTPLQIGTAGAPATIAAPTQSLWQTNSEAVRMLIETSWLQCRNGAVQQLTGVAW